MNFILKNKYLLLPIVFVGLNIGLAYVVREIFNRIELVIPNKVFTAIGFMSLLLTISIYYHIEGVKDYQLKEEEFRKKHPLKRWVKTNE